jgi:hypothetical protein
LYWHFCLLFFVCCFYFFSWQLLPACMCYVMTVEMIEMIHTVSGKLKRHQRSTALWRVGSLQQESFSNSFLPKFNPQQSSVIVL